MTDLTFIKNALIFDETDSPTDKNKLIATNDFDEIRQWSDQVYMPYRVDPLGKVKRPDSTLHAINAGCMIISRFTYGIPVQLKNFDMDAGSGMVLTTTRGCARHKVTNSQDCETASGDSFVVDTSQTDYQADFNPDHLQVNITFPHAYLDKLYTKISGERAPEAIWKKKVKLDNKNSSWLKLLEYVLHITKCNPQSAECGVLGRHLEEMIGTHLLIEWSQCSGIDILQPDKGIAPATVIKAEKYIREHASEAPTLSEVALAVGISIRTLTGGFKKYRNTTPHTFIQECRLQGVRSDLLRNSINARISEVAYSWGFINLGRFAAQYRDRFGELPSETLKRKKIYSV